MMTIEEILSSIKSHREQEIDGDVYHPAFGRSDGISNNEKTTFWIVLNQHRSGFILDIDSPVSRDTPLGAILIQNYEGVHTYNVRGKFKGEFYTNTVQIFNRAKYKTSSDENVLATDLIINISGDTRMYSFRNLIEVFSKLTSLRQNITAKKEEIEKANVNKKTVDVEQLRKDLQEEERQQRIYLDDAQRFIRKNAELRWQPILDREQDAIRRMKIFDGGTLIINGGPGTGKTTSLIQRIKFLTSSTIEEYKTLNKKQKEIIFNRRTSWIFFSPSKLLAQFLKNSMAEEGLVANDNTVKVWEKYKESIIRLYGWVEEEKRVFKLFKYKNNLFHNHPNNIKKIIYNFNEYYIERQKKRLQEKNIVTVHLNLKDIFQKYFESEYKEYLEKQKKNTNYIPNDEKVYQSIFNKIIAFLMDDIPRTYKAFRKERFSMRDENYNLELFRHILEHENQSIDPDEQAFLIYIVNTTCYDIFQKYNTYFQDTNNPYVRTYMTHCRAVIAIDEATDFSIIDLLAMHSLRHPEISSITLSGDLMQRMTAHGLESWESFSDMVELAQKENLTVSYRQSPTLLSLAQSIYQYSTKEKAEYTSYMTNNSFEPKPLMKISETQIDKLKWIADRIREIDIIYRNSVGALPSVAVFVPKENDINDIVNELDEILNGDIPVQGCPNGVILGDSSDVRVYAIDKIKGLEFEAVFFHDLDKLAISQDSLLLKYLYVGLSRATFYLGVTLSNNLATQLHFIEEKFVQNGNWQMKKDKK
jgi:hypothetical protein